MRCTSALTFRIHPGRPRSTLRPDSDSVLSITYVDTASLLGRSRASSTNALAQRWALYQTGASRLDALRNIYTEEKSFRPKPWDDASRSACCAAGATTTGAPSARGVDGGPEVLRHQVRGEARRVVAARRRLADEARHRMHVLHDPGVARRLGDDVGQDL